MKSWADDLTELAAFIAEQLVVDEREIAAAIVRGKAHVVRTDGDGQVIDMRPVRMAWDDLPAKATILREHTPRRPDGRCWECGWPWPCDMLVTFLRPWADRPGFRREWLGE